MPRPALRTRSKKRRRVKSSGGRVETHYGKEKTEVSRCARCGRALSGLPRPDPSKLRKLPASQRRVERMYGGHLCHSCLRDLLKHEARNI
ncbi:MAG: 50S ribosomal protein L34e [Candidatus Bathyarchaeota archaeon]|nr:50S ribosomal protein L34e [Candidatus Bathyarchaeota archaeon]MDH5663018.1 50S ribosomal protein L34e [Candidatus Bathyarchaeota archaeon]